MSRQRVLIVSALLLLAALVFSSVGAVGEAETRNEAAELVAATERTVAATSIRADSERVGRVGDAVRARVQIFQAPDRVKTLQNPGRPGSADPSQSIRVGDATYLSADRPGTYHRSEAPPSEEPAFPGWAELKLVLGADSVSRDGSLYSFHYRVQLTDAVADVKGEATVEDGHLSRLRVQTTAGARHSDTTFRYSAVGSAPPVDVPPDSALVPAPPVTAVCGDGAPPDRATPCSDFAVPGAVDLPLVADPRRPVTARPDPDEPGQPRAR